MAINYIYYLIKGSKVINSDHIVDEDFDTTFEAPLIFNIIKITAIRCSRERIINESKKAILVESDNEPISVAKCTLRIKQKAQIVIIDRI
ncbi:16935_t:CDS:2 [Funneliformis caledonium]|uniref:16935_t:CDS:1 n=1 Tax=Funneliformis caledonium TaxID=1117310 RepID=A0A9N8VXH7_9GLOM|nr:16935_t:CDS:2 [Funneliformis caledonium]